MNELMLKEESRDADGKSGPLTLLACDCKFSAVLWILQNLQGCLIWPLKNLMLQRQMQTFLEGDRQTPSGNWFHSLDTQKKRFYIILGF